MFKNFFFFLFTCLMSCFLISCGTYIESEPVNDSPYSSQTQPPHTEAEKLEKPPVLENSQTSLPYQCRVDQDESIARDYQFQLEKLTVMGMEKEAREKMALHYACLESKPESLIYFENYNRALVGCITDHSLDSTTLPKLSQDLERNYLYYPQNFIPFIQSEPTSLYPAFYPTQLIQQTQAIGKDIQSQPWTNGGSHLGAWDYSMMHQLYRSRFGVSDDQKVQNVGLLYHCSLEINRLVKMATKEDATTKGFKAELKKVASKSLAKSFITHLKMLQTSVLRDRNTPSLIGDFQESLKETYERLHQHLTEHRVQAFHDPFQSFSTPPYWETPWMKVNLERGTKAIEPCGDPTLPSLPFSKNKEALYSKLVETLPSAEVLISNHAGKHATLDLCYQTQKVPGFKLEEKALLVFHFKFNSKTIEDLYENNPEKVEFISHYLQKFPLHGYPQELSLLNLFDGNFQTPTPFENPAPMSLEVATFKYKTPVSMENLEQQWEQVEDELLGDNKPAHQWDVVEQDINDKHSFISTPYYHWHQARLNVEMADWDYKVKNQYCKQDQSDQSILFVELTNLKHQILVEYLSRSVSPDYHDDLDKSTVEMAQMILKLPSPPEICASLVRSENNVAFYQELKNPRFRALESDYFQSERDLIKAISDQMVATTRENNFPFHPRYFELTQRIGEIADNILPQMEEEEKKELHRLLGEIQKASQKPKAPK